MTSREMIPVERAGRVRDVRVGPDGFVYLVNDERGGGIFRLEPVR